MNERPDSDEAVPPDPEAGDDATMISGRPEESAGSGGGSTAPRQSAGRGTTTEIGQLLEGSMLGAYRLDHFIGGGGMGAVFQALDTTLHRTVAIKVLARQQSDDEENLRRFRNEAQSAARLDHENIGRVHAVGSDQGWHYIVLEYIEGMNLRDLVRAEGPFDPARAVDVSIQVAEALEHASQRAVVHRDIKPSNIVITPAGRARIVDMGLARLHQVAGDGDLTASGMTLGTFDYISPEQARDPRAADVRSDLYSLGCTMYFMLAGEPPFADGTMVQKLLKHQQAEPPGIGEVRSDVPKRLAGIIRRLMEKDPGDRYQRPAVLVAELVACAEEQGFAVTAPRPTTSPGRAAEPGSSRLLWLVPATLLVALVGGLWFRSAAVRRDSVAVALPAVFDVPLTVAGPVIAPRESDAGVVRVVADTAALTEAITIARDGEIVEIDADGDFELPPFSVAGRRLTIRAASGREPALSIMTAADGAAVQVGDGKLTMRGVAVRLPEASRPATGRRSMFVVAGGRLSCEAVLLRMPGAGRQMLSVAETAAFVQVVDLPGTASSIETETEIDFVGVRAAGDANLLDIQSPQGGRVVFRWDSGAAVIRRLLASEGGRGSDLVVSASLTDVVAACADGLVVLRDSPTQPRIPRIDVQASGCRFVVADPARSFIEQAGIAAPEAYLAACSWRDLHGRYEGSQIFQRIDGAAERIEIAFGQPSAPLVHDSRVGDLPRPSDWAGWGD